MEETLPESCCFRPAGRVVLRHIGEDRLLVPVAGPAANANCVFPVNNTGAFIWEQLSSGQTLEKTAQALEIKFSVTVENARADCTAFARKMLDEKLLEVIAA